VSITRSVVGEDNSVSICELHGGFQEYVVV